MTQDKKEITTKEAITKLCEALKEDESYRDSWVANIAMAFIDEFNKVYPQHKLGVHSIANTAADNFINQLIS